MHKVGYAQYFNKKKKKEKKKKRGKMIQIA